MPITMTAPLFGTHGTSIAALEICVIDAEPSGPTHRLLSALLHTTTRAVAERMFRMRYSRFWIVAAWCPQIDKHALFAVNAEQRLVGADRGARDLFATKERDDHLPALDCMFVPPLPRLSNRRAETLLERCGKDGLPWRIMITPPTLSAVRALRADVALLHSRPRLDALVNTRSPVPQLGSRGLPVRLVRQVQEYVDTHLELSLSIKQLATKLGFSKSHFGRSFHRAVGVTPHEYVMQRRILRAQEMLLQTDTSLIDIALATGFSDQSHFCRRFHQRIGLPPRAFRMQHRIDPPRL